MPKENSLVQAKTIQDIARLWMKGSTKADIAEKMSLSQSQVSNYIKQWEEFVEEEAEKNPDVLDNYLENTIKFEQEIKLLTQEAWNVIELAEENGAMGTKIQALKLAKELTEMKARLFQLLSPRMEHGYVERQKRVERVNSILSSIMREVISGCDRCRAQAWDKLQVAYSMME